MASIRESSVEVLVIGAGPAGLFAAAELARHGLRPRVVEQCRQPHNQSRATGIQPSTLEVFNRAGLVEKFLPHCLKLRGSMVMDGSLATAFSTSFDKLDTVYAFGTVTPQWKTEQLLDQHLGSFGVRVERGICAKTIEADTDSSIVHLVHADDSEETVRAKYTIGAGGARGGLRGALHEHLDGTTYPLRFLVVDFTTNFPFDRDHVCFFMTQAGLLMVAALPDEHWLAVVDAPDGALSATPPGLEEVRAVFDAHLPGKDVVRDLHWASFFHTHRRIAPCFGDARRFLVGDAAHICSPFGGEGMNCGLQDGADLAWKLALVSRGLGREILLENYHSERRTVAEQVLASADAMHRGYYQLVELATEGKKMEPLPPDPAHPVISPSLLDVSFRKSPLVGEFCVGGTVGLPVGAPGTRFRDRTLLAGTKHTLLCFSGKQNTAPSTEVIASRWKRQVEFVDGNALGPQVGARAGLPEGGALLVRPDGFVGFRANPWNADALAALDAHLAKQMIPV